MSSDHLSGSLITNSGRENDALYVPRLVCLKPVAFDPKAFVLPHREQPNRPA